LVGPPELRDKSNTYSQGFYFDTRAGGEVRVFGSYNNKQTNKQSNKVFGRKVHMIKLRSFRPGTSGHHYSCARVINGLGGLVAWRLYTNKQTNMPLSTHSNIN